MDASETHLIEQARGGDHRAFRSLIDRHARPLYGVCHRILGDAAAAEDAVQDALLSAFRALDRFDGRSSFGTWLHRIAVNAAIAELRARKPEVGFDDLSSVHDDEAAIERAVGPHVARAATPETVALGHDLGLKVAGALDRLTPLERTAFVLKHVEQYSLDEIARAIDSNTNACKQAIFRAVGKLRLALAPMRSDP